MREDKPVFPAIPIADATPATIRSGKGVILSLTITWEGLEDLDKTLKAQEENFANTSSDPEFFDHLEWSAFLENAEIQVSISKTRKKPTKLSDWGDPRKVTAINMRRRVHKLTNFWGVSKNKEEDGEPGRGIIAIFGGQWINIGIPIAKEDEREWEEFCEALNSRNRLRGFHSPFTEDLGKPAPKRRPAVHLFPQLCPECGTEFQPTRRGQVYDSHKCAARVSARKRRGEARTINAFESTDIDSE